MITITLDRATLLAARSALRIVADQSSGKHWQESYEKLVRSHTDAEVFGEDQHCALLRKQAG